MHSNREPLAKLAEVTGDHKLMQQYVAFLITSHSWELVRLSEIGCLINPVYLVMRSAGTVSSFGHHTLKEEKTVE